MPMQTNSSSAALTGADKPNLTATPIVPPADPVAAGNLVEKIQIKDLRFYYKKYEALKTINLSLADKRVTAFIGPSGCGKSTLLRVLNRMYELYPEQRADGRGAGRRRATSLIRDRPQPAARQDRHGVPEADAVPDVDLRQHRLRHPPLREPAPGRARRPRRAGAAQRGPVGRGQGQAEAERAWACRAASSSACASRARSRSSRRSCCSTSRARRSTRSRPRRSRS